MGAFSYIHDFDIPFSELEEVDQSWLMTKVWAHLKIRNLKPATPLPARYLPQRDSKVYQIWLNLRENAKTEDLRETSDWWLGNGFAEVADSELPAFAEGDTEDSEETTIEEEVAALVKKSFRQDGTMKEGEPEGQMSEDEVVNHFLNHSGPLTDPQTVLLMFRWLEMNTSASEFLTGHFRHEMDRRKIQLKNVDSTLSALEKKGQVHLITSTPRKTYEMTDLGRTEVRSLVALCPSFSSGEELPSLVS